MDFKSFLKNNQQAIAISVGFLLVASISFGLGNISAYKYSIPEIRVEEVFSPSNNTQKVGSVQSANVDNCAGLIKGNINSKGKKVYHVPDGSFYDQTNPEQCFETEDEAKKAGFVKSSR